MIGKKIRGFKFSTDDYSKQMDDYIGKIGIISNVDSDGDCKVIFEDDYFYYPKDLCLQHLVEEDIPTKDLNLKHLVIKSNMPSPFNDNSTIPTHYQTGKEFDVIDFCKMYNLNFNLGNVVKYCARAGKKDDIIKDLKKALDYLQREIKHLEV